MNTTISHTEGAPEVLRSKGSMEDGNGEYDAMVVSACASEQKGEQLQCPTGIRFSELNDHAERVGGSPAPSPKCSCTRICLRNLHGDNRECAPAERYFYVVRDRYVKSADGDCEWDGDFLPGRHATFEAALEVVSTGHPISRFVIEEVPRFGMFPKWSGHPEDARAQLAKSSPLELMEIIAR